MRPGLIAVGVAFAVVGAAVIVGILYPGDNPPLERTGSSDVVGLPGGDWRSFLLPASASDPATLTLSWSATGTVNVTWYSARVCTQAPGICVDTPPLRLWLGNSSGHWSATGSADSLYELVVYAGVLHNQSVNFTAAFTEQYHAGPQTLPFVPFAITMVGGSLLTGIGAVVLYLGLFLPSGVYGAEGDLGPEPEERPPGPVGPEPPA